MSDITKESDSIDIGKYFGTLWRWRQFIVVNLAVIATIAVIVSLVLPKWYRARASVMPPKQQEMSSPLGAASSLLRGLGGASRLASLGNQTGAYNYLAILKSRSVMSEVVRKFDLIRVYSIDNNSVEDAIEALRGNVSFELQDENYITVDVLDKDPGRAADMANFFVDALNKISVQLGTQEARNNREFIEKRLDQVKLDLKNAEDLWKEDQQKSGMLIAPTDNNSSIGAIAELYAMKAKKEIELGILERTVSKDNSQLEQTKIVLQELNLRVNKIPDASVDALRLYRNVAIQEKILEYVVPMYEQAKIEEQKDVPVILVLDKAIPPERKASPKRVLIVLVSVLASLIISAIVALFVEALRARMSQRGSVSRDEQRTMRYSEIWRILRPRVDQ